MKDFDLKRVIRLKLSSVEDAAITHALRAQQNAYAPYSGYKVGAAVIALDNSIFVGVNAENHIYVVSHAEVNACTTMIASGRSQFHTLICAAQDSGIPCGMCLQITREWALSDLSKVIVIGVSTKDPYNVTRCTFEEALQVTDAPHYKCPTSYVFALVRT